MKTLLITGGMIETDFALSFMKKMQADHIVAVDRGLAFCYAQGISPDYIVGDFDSLDPAVLAWYSEKGETAIRRFNPVKDATDTMIALDYALQAGSSEIWILGATGGRLDHLFGNLQILKNAWELQVPAWIVDSRNLAGLLCGHEVTLEKEGQYGRYVSFFSLEEKVEGLTLEGFKYPLRDATLVNRYSLGVSNEIVSPGARVTWRDGILLMMQTRD